MKQKQHSIHYNFIMNFILSASSILFPLITFPYVSRVILPVGTGKVAFAMSTAAYFTMAAMLGIPTYGVRAVAQNKNDPVKLALVLKELLCINLFMSLFAYAAFGAALFLVPQMAAEKTLMIIASASIFLNVIGVTWLFQGLEDYSAITLVSLIFKVIAVVTMFLFIHTEQDYLWYGVMTVLSSFGSGFVNFFRAIPYLKAAKGMKMDFRRHMKPIMVFFGMTVATTVYTNLDTVMLGFMKSDYDVGIYNAAIKIKSLLVTLVTSLGTVMLPRLSEYASQNRNEEFKALISKAISFVLLFSIPVSLFCMVMARPTILLISGQDYLAAAMPMIILMPTLVLIGLSNITGIQILVPTGKEKQVMISVCAGAVTDLLINCLLIPSMASSGAAIGTLIAETVVTAWQFWILRSMLRKILPKTEWKQLILVLLVSIPAFWFIRLEIFSSLPVFIYLAVSGIIYFGMIGITLLLSGEQILNGIIHRKV
ncbi:flippase [Ileibacterium valens]|uniref:flippase n=1 Tax=Ileibacterium valens TaxID=1862668 RepID=UPI00257268B3|nr:flippase [Ileibacterium valens]